MVLTGYPEERYALAMIRNGANGYLCKGCGRDELLLAVRTVAQGRRYLSQNMAELLADEVTGGNPELPHQQLSNENCKSFCDSPRASRFRPLAKRCTSASKPSAPIAPACSRKWASRVMPSWRPMPCATAC